jgi:hypothetical protein
MKFGQWLAILGCVGTTGTASIASQGCTTTVSTGDGSGDDTGNPTPGDDAGTPATQEDSGSVPLDSCNSCLYGQCSGVYSICANDTGCLAIYQCATAPACVSDAACVGACVSAQSASAQALYGDLSTCDLDAECNGGTCATECNPSADYCTAATSDDAGVDANPSVSDDAGASPDDAGESVVDSAGPLTCAQCQASHCSAQETACADGTACGTYNQCVLGCSTAECVTICGTDNPSGVTAAQALGTCTTTNCAVCSQ